VTSEAPHRPRVLLADDEADLVENLSALLSRSGFEVIRAYDGAAALDAVRRDVPDLCVFDVMMPGLDGREVVRRMRAGGSAVPVLLLTEVGESMERAMAIEEGADDYLNKPFDPHELLARMRALQVVMGPAISEGCPAHCNRALLGSGRATPCPVGARSGVGRLDPSATS
jgi:DNA-binding response OmpR family regulator